jgi:hypothetical protein
MSAEKIISKEDNISALVTPEVLEKELPGRVNINELLARVREEKKKENKVNLIFFGLFASIIFVVGIILSL